MWYSDGVVRFLERGGTRRRLSGSPAGFNAPQIAASTTSVALKAGGQLTGGEPPAPLAAIRPGRPVGGRECRGWVPATQNISNFVVVQDQLVLGASEACGSPRSSAPQPLFIRSLRGGPWRVMRWLSTTAPPVLASDGGLLAVGVQRALEPMEVTVIDVHDGSSRAHFGVPDGVLSFARKDRLVLSVAKGAQPFGPEIESPEGSFTIGFGFRTGPYHVELYSTDGHRVASLGASERPPLASGMHLVAVRRVAGAPGVDISVRALPYGPTKDVIGFNPPGRTLLGVALRWPVLALVMTTSNALPNGEFSCRYGSYGPPSAPFVLSLNLARPRPFLAAPIPPPQPDPRRVFATCGPPPP